MGKAHTVRPDVKISEIEENTKTKIEQIRIAKLNIRQEIKKLNMEMIDLDQEYLRLVYNFKGTLIDAIELGMVKLTIASKDLTKRNL